MRKIATRFHPEGETQCETIKFSFGRKHPAYQMEKTSFGTPDNGSAWYVRIPNVTNMVSHLKPLFERRLSESYLSGWSGNLKISYNTSGLQMTFDNGRITTVEATGPIEPHDAAAHYPDLTFAKALLGQHSFTHLRGAYADCFAKNHAMETMQNILFGGPLIPAVFPCD